MPKTPLDQQTPFAPQAPISARALLENLGNLEHSTLAQDNHEIRDLIDHYWEDLWNVLVSHFNMEGDQDFLITDEQILAELHQIIKEFHSELRLHLQFPAVTSEKEPVPETEKLSIKRRLAKDYQEYLDFFTGGWFHFSRKDGPDGHPLYSYKPDFEAEDISGDTSIQLLANQEQMVQAWESLPDYRVPAWDEIREGLTDDDYRAFQKLVSKGFAPFLQLTPIGYGFRTGWKRVIAKANQRMKNIWKKPQVKFPPPRIEFDPALEDHLFGYDARKIIVTNSNIPVIRLRDAIKKHDWIAKNRGWLVEIAVALPENAHSLPLQVYEKNESDTALAQTDASKALSGLELVRQEIQDSYHHADSLDSALCSSLLLLSRMAPGQGPLGENPRTLVFPGSLIGGSRLMPVCHWRNNTITFGLLGHNFNNDALESDPEGLVKMVGDFSYRPVRRLQPKWREKA